MDEQTPIDRLYKEASAVIQTLQQNAELSLQVSASDYFRKALLLAASSHFEHRVCDLVLVFVREKASGSTLVEQFVHHRAIARQYHTWFEWDGNNANKFFSSFGPDFLANMKMQIKESPQLSDSIKAFLEIGSERNRLVHQDYATFAMEKTMDNIYELYQKALMFIENLPILLRKYDSNVNINNS